MNGIWSDIATYIGPTVNETPGDMSTVLGVVLHIQQGSEAGTEAWERNPKSQVSSHFLAPKSGGLRQMVPVTDKAWCEVAGNRHWLSVECEGLSGQTLTLPQLVACATLLRKAHTVFGVPLREANRAGATTVAAGGLGYHAMGGVAWGGHLDCPGTPIIAQRSTIIRLAGELLPSQPPTEGTTMGNANTEDFLNRVINGHRVADILGREEGSNEEVPAMVALIVHGIDDIKAAVAKIPLTPAAFTDAQVANVAAGVASRLPQLSAVDEPTVRAALIDVLTHGIG
jgi:hypothetical protein